MGLQRRSRFGFPPPTPPDSAYTVRMVPLTTGVRLDQPWPLLPPGSTTSMTNYLPLDGALVPRSRLSSINTIRIPGTATHTGMAQLTRADFGSTTIWASGVTTHALVTSNGSISRASFVSSFGLGVAGLPSQFRWQYTQAYNADIDENMLLAVGRFSANTVIAIYQTSGSAIGAPLYSYLTSAPMAMAIGSFDNYVIAFNCRDGGVAQTTRVRWCVRGNPSNWTSEGSGFEDLLQARGSGTAVWPLDSDRYLLFTNMETWTAIGATYPMQFQFSVLDAEIGCPFPETLATTDLGVVFVGSDMHLRVLPTGGGKSQAIVPSLSKYLRRNVNLNGPTSSWAVYDPTTKLYHLHLSVPGSARADLVVNLETGEWGFLDYGSPEIVSGIAGLWDSNNWPAIEGLFFLNSNGTVLSTHSLKSSDSLGSIVTSTWRSTPLASDLAGNWKQLSQVNLDYRATSKATLNLAISQDGGNNYSSVGVVSLGSAPVSGRASLDVYRGGAFCALEVTSTSTGYELHRAEVAMHIGGRG